MPYRPDVLACILATLATQKVWTFPWSAKSEDVMASEAKSNARTIRQLYNWPCGEWVHSSSIVVLLGPSPRWWPHRSIVRPFNWIIIILAFLCHSGASHVARAGAPTTHRETHILRLPPATTVHCPLGGNLGLCARFDKLSRFKWTESSH